MGAIDSASWGGDPLAASVGSAVAVANAHAAQLGWDLTNQKLLVSEGETADSIALWRISYYPRTEPGRFARGGGYIIDVNAAEGNVYRAYFGQ